MNNVTVINDDGSIDKVNVIARFKIPEYHKDYMLYTSNDNGMSEKVMILISEVEEQSNGLYLKTINEKEKNMVLVFYDNIRDTLMGKR